MSHPTRWQRLRERLAEPFRVSVIREETFEEVGTYQVNRANLGGLALGAVVVTALATFALVAVTPLRALLPGFGAIDERSEVVELERQLAGMEEEIAAHRAYAANVQRILTGDVSEYDRAAAAAQAAELPDSSLVAVERIPEDEALRRDVAGGRARGAAQLEGGVPLDHLNFAAPVDGQVSGAFAPARRHFGVDLVAPVGTAVKATLDGYVVEAGWTLETGNVIALQHAGNLLTFYKHNASLLKRAGDFVRAGEAIATLGNTGTHTDGPHLHFELWFRGRAIDPAAYVGLE